MQIVKIIVGLAIIGFSFYYVLKNNTSMLENLLKKSEEEYDKREAIKEKAYNVVDGKADAFDTIKEAVQPVVEDVKKRAGR